MDKYIVVTKCPFSKSSCNEDCLAKSVFDKGLKVPVVAELTSLADNNAGIVNYKVFKKALKKDHRDAFHKFKSCKTRKRLRGIRNLYIMDPNYDGVLDSNIEISDSEQIEEGFRIGASAEKSYLL